MRKATLTLLAISICLVACGGAYPATPKVTLTPRVEVQPARPVTIKDIARIDGPKEAIRKIGGLTVATGPLPGKCTTLETSYVQLRLRAEVKGAVNVRGPERVELIGKCIKFSSDTLTERAKAYVSERLPRDSRTYEVQIDRSPRELVVAAGSTPELRPRLLNPTLQPGPKAVVVDVVTNQRVLASATVALSVKATAEVLVATKSIRQNEALGPENTAWDRRDVSKLPQAVVKGEIEATGWLARRGISPGSAVSTDDIALPFTVHRGETAALTVTCGAVTLRTTAEIRQDARVGDNVRIRPVVSQEDIQAKVLGPGAVAVER